MDFVPPVTLAPGPKSTDTRVRKTGATSAFLQQDGVFRVQDGLAGAPTKPATEPLAQYELEGNRIGVLFVHGLFRVKDGINGGWTDLAVSDVREFQLQGNLIGFIRESDGTLLVKDGPNDARSVGEDPYGPNVSQFRLVVDVPTRPFRTTPATHPRATLLRALTRL